jgi:hypothetical protein
MHGPRGGLTATTVSEECPARPVPDDPGLDRSGGIALRGRLQGQRARRPPAKCPPGCPRARAGEPQQRQPASQIPGPEDRGHGAKQAGTTHRDANHDPAGGRQDVPKHEAGAHVPSSGSGSGSSTPTIVTAVARPTHDKTEDSDEGDQGERPGVRAVGVWPKAASPPIRARTGQRRAAPRRRSDHEPAASCDRSCLPLARQGERDTEECARRCAARRPT